MGHLDPDASGETLILLLDLIEQHTGFSHSDTRRELIVDKLAPLVMERGLDSFLDYYYLLRYDEHADLEWRKVESALAVNETYFWREYDQIRVAAEVLVPGWQAQRIGQPLRIWDAACATGEEPYSLAIALQEAGRYDFGPVEIFATDFNTEALALARTGIYRGRSFRMLPGEIQARYFTPLDNGRFRLDEAIRSRVQFSYLNLLDGPAMAQMTGFDLIFCRNVFIYLSEQAIRKVVQSFYRALCQDGYLFIAAVESLLRITNLMDLVEVGGAFAYRKVPVADRNGGGNA